MPQKKGGIMVILSSPSGAGKTTLVNLLSKKNNFFISTTPIEQYESTFLVNLFPKANRVDVVQLRDDIKKQLNKYVIKLHKYQYIEKQNFEIAIFQINYHFFP